jgi:hypothetical protein
MSSRQHSFLVDEFPAGEKTSPRAVVLLLGWWGARTKHLTKYAKLYQDQNCLTVRNMLFIPACLRHVVILLVQS